MSLYLGTITISSPAWVSSLSALGLTVAIATLLLASNFTIIYAQLSLQQQGVQSNGGLTAALNGSSFTRGDTITVTGSVGERDPNSQVLIRVIDPQSKQVETGTAYITADNTFTYSFVAGEQKQFESDDPMTTSGNYRMIVSYVTPGFDNEAVELVFAYNGTPQQTESAATTTTTTTTATIQQQQAPPIVNGVMTTFRSTGDSFSIGVPQGWIINDLDNTGLAASDEAMMGYAILAQLCPVNELEQRPTQQSPAMLSNNNASGSNTSSCQTSENDVIYIIRYPDLDSGGMFGSTSTTINNSGGSTTADSVLSYHLQKLQELGYSDLQIGNMTDTNVNLINPQTNQTLILLPAKLVEVSYTIASNPNQIKGGYFVLTSTAATAPYPGTTKGYVVFYEGNSSTTNANNNSSVARGITRTTTATSSFGLPPTPLQPLIGQILKSFELMAVPEISPPPLGPQTLGVGQPTAVLPVGGNEQGDDGGGANDASEDEDGEEGDTSSCDSSYPDTCIPPPPPDLNCDDISASNFRVQGSDPHGFDGDDDGIGCESAVSVSGGNDIDNNDDDEAGGSDDGGGADDVSDDDDGVDDGDDEVDNEGSSDDGGSSRCPNGTHRSPSGDCETVTDTRGMPRCPNGFHRSPDGDCERVR